MKQRFDLTTNPNDDPPHDDDQHRWARSCWRLLARPARRGRASTMKRAAALRVLGVSDDLDSNAVRQAYRCVRRRARPPRCRSARVAFPARGVSLVFEPCARPRSRTSSSPELTLRPSPPALVRCVRRKLALKHHPGARREPSSFDPAIRAPAARAPSARPRLPANVKFLLRPSPAKGRTIAHAPIPLPRPQTKTPATPRRSSDSRRW